MLSHFPQFQRAQKWTLSGNPEHRNALNLLILIFWWHHPWLGQGNDRQLICTKSDNFPNMVVETNTTFWQGCPIDASNKSICIVFTRLKFPGWKHVLIHFKGTSCWISGRITIDTLLFVRRWGAWCEWRCRIAFGWTSRFWDL